LCKQWLQLYAQNSELAIVQLIEFMLEASGSQYHLPADAKFPLNYTNIIIAATTQFGNKSSSYPLMMRTCDYFKRDVSSFVQLLLRLMGSNSLLLDAFFLKNLSGFLLVCTDSKVRAFRHTSTWIALKMMSSLNALVTLQQEQLKEIWLNMFGGIFMQRIADVVEDIRHLCIAECGLWLEKYPACMLLPRHVKHLFKALQDRCSKVCQSSQQALLKLNENPQLRDVCLEQGLQYRMTLLGLTMSSENEVSQLALELLLVFFKADQQILDSAMLQVIEQLLFAAHRGVAQTAAKLITCKQHEASTDKARLLVLLQLFVGCGEHEHAAYLVDAFYGHNECILAWPTMVEMLLEPDSLDSPQTTALIEILTRSVQQAVTGEIPPGRYTEHLERQPLPKASKLATRALLRQLPTLIQKYSSRPEDLTNLLELPQYMSLQKLQFQELLEQIMIIMYEQHNLGVLQMGAMTLERLYELSESAAYQRKELLNNAVTNYMIAYNAWQKSSKDSLKRLLDTLRLVSVLYAHFDLHDWQLGDNVLGILKQQEGLPEEALSLYLLIIYMSFSWDLKRIKDLAKTEQDVAAECLALRSRLEGYFELTFKLMEAQSEASITCKAFVYCCDLFVLFAESSSSGSDSLQTLEYRAKLREYELIETFVLAYIFSGTAAESAADLLQPEQFAELQSRRQVLTGYLKLIFHNVMPMMRACSVFQYYESHYAAFGDLMRATMEHSLSTNPTNFGMTVMHTCLLVYRRIRRTHQQFAQAAASVEFAKLVRLANRLAELFNVKQLAVRPGVLILHRAGIRFAAEHLSDDPLAAPKELLYLGVLQQFVPQLLAQDMLDVVRYLLQYIEHAPLPSSPVEEWQPLYLYRNALMHALRQSCRREF
ncbi:hypothetical protein KR222_003869, partial [Zaprionus bogoriensis]